jgi:hypothetical protein
MERDNHDDDDLKGHGDLRFAAICLSTSNAQARERQLVMVQSNAHWHEPDLT